MVRRQDLDPARAKAPPRAGVHVLVMGPRCSPLEQLRAVVLHLALALGLLAGTARADVLEVVRSATIKAAPSRDAAILVRPELHERLSLGQAPEQNGYLSVIIPGRNELGWIYKTLVRRVPESTVPAATADGFGQLEVHVMNVGQADAILIRCPDGAHEMLIDSGDNRYTGSGAAFKTYMQAHQDQHDRIEVVVASHPHADHIGNMAWLLRNFGVDLYVDDGIEYPSATWRGVETAWEESHAAYASAQDTVEPDIDFCPRTDVSARVVRWPGFGQYDDPNDNSVIVRVDHGSNCLLFVGDLEGTAEADLAADPAARSLIDCDFIKVGHHGSNTSSSAAFLDAVSPSSAAISCGAQGVSTNARYKHPRAETISRFLSYVDAVPSPLPPVTAFATPTTPGGTGEWTTLARPGAVYVTVVDGDIVLVSDGHSIRRAP